MYQPDRFLIWWTFSTDSLDSSQLWNETVGQLLVHCCDPTAAAGSHYVYHIKPTSVNIFSRHRQSLGVSIRFFLLFSKFKQGSGMRVLMINQHHHRVYGRWWKIQHTLSWIVIVWLWEQQYPLPTSVTLTTAGENMQVLSALQGNSSLSFFFLCKPPML